MSGRKGVLENHWNGNIIKDITTVLHLAETMTWKGKHPIVKLVTLTYQTGVKLTTLEMAEVETQIQRLSQPVGDSLPNLGKWFIDIVYSTA
ncbi:ISAzo13-like element transposase-related protein [Microcoleus sp. F4-D5]|uniref:ISAzo13-like element transposase-related protein n=1 Tax=Microcoleus sp. F4-D5 TaxID=2818760 RepID=UPI002FD278A9